MALLKLFPTLVYQKLLLPSAAERRSLNKDLLVEVEDIFSLDVAGQVWSKGNYPNGFTSYASANQLHRFSPTFRKLELAIDKHIAKFSRALHFSLQGKPLKMNSCWINIMQNNAHHSLHLHPLSVISGTYYLETPKGSSPLKFEDPRLGLFMGAPPKKESKKPQHQTFVEIEARAGGLVLFESWLRHEVPQHSARKPRISISFNYGWDS